MMIGAAALMDFGKIITNTITLIVDTVTPVLEQK
jgi:hypothetical protein